MGSLSGSFLSRICSQCAVVPKQQLFDCVAQAKTARTLCALANNRPQQGLVKTHDWWAHALFRAFANVRFARGVPDYVPLPSFHVEGFLLLRFMLS